MADTLLFQTARQAMHRRWLNSSHDALIPFSPVSIACTFRCTLLGPASVNHADMALGSACAGRVALFLALGGHMCQSEVFQSPASPKCGFLYLDTPYHVLSLSFRQSILHFFFRGLWILKMRVLVRYVREVQRTQWQGQSCTYLQSIHYGQ